MKRFHLPVSLLVLLACAGFALAEEDATKTMTLEVEDAPVAAVLEAIAKVSGKNLIVSPEGAQKRVTLQMTEVTWKDALAMVLEVAGLRVKSDDHGILYITAKPKAGKPKIKPASRPDRDEVKAKKKLAAEVEKARARIHEIEVQIEKLRKAKGLAEDHPRIRRSEAEMANMRKKIEALRAHEARMRAAGGEHAGRMHMQIYDLRDLDRDDPDFRALLKGMQEHGAGIQWKQEGRVLVLKGDHDLHERMAHMLHGMRERREHAKEKMRVQREPHATKRKIRVRMDGEGRILREGPQREEHGRHAQARIAHMMEAAELLEAAGAREEAAHVRERARQMEAELHGRGPGGPDELHAAIQALRRDLGALRREVGELNALVRRLLETRAR